MNIVGLLQKGKIGVIPTDTMYGLVGSALIPETVERIYAVRKRTETKPLIVLIAGMPDLDRFGVTLDEKAVAYLENAWPAPLSVVLPVAETFTYLHRGTNTVAFRVPADSKLREMLKKTGPLVAPSANLEGERPAETIEEAKNYFGNKVDFYVDGGPKATEPSTLVEFKEGKMRVLRQGKYLL